MPDVPQAGSQNPVPDPNQSQVVNAQPPQNQQAQDIPQNQPVQISPIKVPQAQLPPVQKPEVQPEKPKRNLFIWIVVVVSLIAIGAIIYFFVFQGGEDSPDLVGTQGFIGLEVEQEKDEEFVDLLVPPVFLSEVDVDRILSESSKLAKWQGVDSLKYQKIQQYAEDKNLESTTIKRGVNFLYSESDITFADVIWQMGLDEDDDGVTISRYDDIQDKFRSYPESVQFGASNHIYAGDPTLERIPAQSGFVVISNQETDAYGLYEAERKSTVNVICNPDIVEGSWKLVPISHKKLGDSVNPCLKDIRFIYIQGKDGEFVLGYDSDVNTVEDLALYDEMKNFMAWIYFETVPGGLSVNYQSDHVILVQQKEDKLLQNQILEQGKIENPDRGEEISAEQSKIQEELLIIQERIDAEKVALREAELYEEILIEIQQTPDEEFQEKMVDDDSIEEEKVSRVTRGTSTVQRSGSTKVDPDKEAIMYFSPAIASFGSCKEEKIKVMVNTYGREISGIDAQIIFDPDEVEIVDYEEGEIFDFYTPWQVENGKVMLSAINTGGNYFTENESGDVFWELKVRGKAGVDKTSLKFGFEPAGSGDSSFVDAKSEEDILKSVESAVLLFKDQGYCVKPSTISDVKTEYRKYNYVDLDEDIDDLVNGTVRVFFDDVAEEDFEDSYGEIAEIWQENLSFEDFTRSFDSYFGTEYDLDYLKTTNPKYLKEPNIVPEGESETMELEGVYYSDKNVVKFRLNYYKEDDKWKSVGMGFEIHTVSNYENIGLYDLTSIDDKSAVNLVNHTMQLFIKDILRENFKATYDYFATSLKRQMSFSQFDKASANTLNTIEMAEVDLSNFESMEPTFELAPRLRRGEMDVAVLETKGSFPTSPRMLFELEYVFENPDWVVTQFDVSIE